MSDKEFIEEEVVLTPEAPEEVLEEVSEDDGQESEIPTGPTPEELQAKKIK
jgi:hypothetical protein